MDLLDQSTESGVISAGYRDLQRELHARPRGYGGRGSRWAPVVVRLARKYGADSILDYGCGEGSLARAVRAMAPEIRVTEYDPAIVGKDGPPFPEDLVNATDVLEHIESDRLDAVLAHIRTLARKAVFVVISTKLSNKVMQDGRNAHLIVESVPWWTARLQAAGFTVHRPPKGVHPRASDWAAVLTP